jgi:ubiquitin carboxyl-terminal hydrolase 10
MGLIACFSVAFLNEFKPKVGPGPIDATSFPTASASASLPNGPSTSSSKPSGSRDPTLLPRNSFTASHLYNSLKSNSRFDAMRSGQQEDAEEFLGFYLDGLHEELCALLALLGDSPDVPDAGSHDAAWGEGSESGAVTGSGQDDGWQEIGKKNRAMVTRTVSLIGILS